MEGNDEKRGERWIRAPEKRDVYNAITTIPPAGVINWAENQVAPFSFSAPVAAPSHSVARVQTINARRVNTRAPSVPFEKNAVNSGCRTTYRGSPIALGQNDRVKSTRRARSARAKHLGEKAQKLNIEFPNNCLSYVLSRSSPRHPEFGPHENRARLGRSPMRVLVWTERALVMFRPRLWRRNNSTRLNEHNDTV